MIVVAVVLSTSHTFQVCFSYIHLDVLTFYSLLFFWSATRRKTKFGVLVFHPRDYSVMYMFYLRF